MLRRMGVLAAAAALSLAACGGSGGSGGGATRESGLAAAMASVSGNGPAATYFEYGDLAALRELGVIHPGAPARGSGAIYDQRWARVAGIGDATLVTYSALTPKLIGVNALAGDTAIAIGEPPDTATRIDAPMDAKAISAKLTSLGAKPRSFAGTPGLSFGPDNSLGLPSTGKLGDPKYGTLSLFLRQIVVTDRTFAVSPNAATLDTVLSPGPRSLLDTPHYRDLATCLGDVLAAVVTSPSAGSGANADTRSQLLAVGVRRPNAATGPVDEVLCVLPKAGQLRAVRGSLAQRLAPQATDPISKQPISSSVSKTVVDDTGDLVRAVLRLKPTTAVGYLITGLYDNATPYWDGSCTGVNLAKRTC